MSWPRDHGYRAGCRPTQVVVEEAEGPPFGQRRQPERQLGELDRQRVLVDAIKAALGDEAAGEDGALLGIVRQRLEPAAPRVSDDRPSLSIRLPLASVERPGFDQPIGEPAASLNQECAGSHGRVADFQVEQFLGALQLPVLGRLSLGRAAVGDRRQRLGDDLLGQALRRVVRAVSRRSAPSTTTKAPS